MDRKALLFPCGLVLSSAYLSTAPPIEHSFALDKPLHTAAVVLLLTGLTVAAAEAWPSRKASQTSPSAPPPLPPRYIAIQLGDGNRTPLREELWTEAGQPGRRRACSVKAVGALLAVLLFAVCGRLGVWYRVVRGVECSGPSSLAFIPFVLALCHSIRHPSQRQYPAWSADARPRSQLDRLLHFLYDGSTRYIVPSALLSVSAFLVGIKTSLLRSTYICPTTDAPAVAVSSLQFLGFLLDCVVAQTVFRLVDDAVSPLDDWSIRLEDGTSNCLLVGLTLTASSCVLIVAGIIVYPALPEHREWMLALPSEYLLGLLRLSLMIPFMTLCFLKSARLYGVMSAVLIPAFSSAYVGVLRALGTGVSFSFPPKSTVSLILCLILLTIALILHLVTNTNLEMRIRSSVAVRLGRNHAAVLVLLLIAFSVGVIVYRLQPPLTTHPISTLIDLATVQHEQWASQAYRSKSLAEAVVHYRQRYNRDPPPNFDAWYNFAMARNSIIVDDFDNIENDLVPFSSFTPDDLRLRTATVLATRQDVGGVRITDGKVEVSTEVPGENRWILDGIIEMIQDFAEYLPDMHLAFNLQEQSRVAVSHSRVQDALENPQPYPTPNPARSSTKFSADRSSQWPDVSTIRSDPTFFENATAKPSFQTYSSIACPSDSRARKERHWSTKTFCATCTQPHSMGAFISNWTLAADPCHQPDLANLHGLHLSPSTLSGTHDIVPIFSQSRAKGYLDIRYPSAWDYTGRTNYEFDEKYPDPHFIDKEDVFFWRGNTSEGSSNSGAWKGMLFQRLVHLLNNSTARHPILLPASDHTEQFEYILQHAANIKHHLDTKTDVLLSPNATHCSAHDCTLQNRELGFAPEPIDFRAHWHYRYLLVADGPSASPHLLPFLRSNSAIFHTTIHQTWYTGRLTPWTHFIPLSPRLHDLFSILAFFGGWGNETREKRMMAEQTREAERIARQGKVWSEKVVRKEDMEVYMFRLLLEWGRLTDDRRIEVGFGMGKE